MDNSTLGTQDTERRQTKQKTQHRKLKRWATANCSQACTKQSTQ